MCSRIQIEQSVVVSDCIDIMAYNRHTDSEMPIYAFITFLLTRSYAVTAILQKRGYVEDSSASYKVEDFLWSGSGDGENETDVNIAEEDVWWQYTTTIIQTTTIMWTSTSTVYRNRQYTPTIVTTPSISDNKRDNCSHDIECNIKPTPTRQPTVISPWPPPTQAELPFGDQTLPDRRYWIVTVLKLNSTSALQFVPTELQRHLANLYELAFRRHQEQHLGGNERWPNKAHLRSRFILRKRRDNREPVTVRIHNVTTDNLLKIVYSVSVSGHPVLATTAAHDMTYVSDAEVVAELGYPVFTKAEPFLKSNDPSSEQIVPGVSWKTKYSLLAASITAIVALIFCLLVFILLKNCKKKPKRTMMEKDDRLPPSSSASNYRQRTELPEGEGESDINNIRKLKRRCSRELSSEDNQQNQSNIGLADSQNDGCLRTRSTGRPSASPHSYLSMPSVKEFPSTPLPESLATVLSQTRPNSNNEQETNTTGQKFSRHSSLGDDDPGVVGPVVWQTFRHQRDDELDVVGDNSPCEAADIDLKDVRKRFNRLLDEALSIRSSQEFSDEQEQLSSRRTITERYESTTSRSIIRNREPINRLDCVPTQQPRPRTSLNVSHQPNEHVLKTEAGRGRARNAWCSNVPPTPVRSHSRPLSAGPFHRPTMHPEFILTDSKLSADDPVVPIISAIKRELDKIPKYEPARREKRSSKLRTTHSED